MPCAACGKPDFAMQRERRPAIKIAEDQYVCYDCGTVKDTEPEYLSQGYRAAYGDGVTR